MRVLFLNGTVGSGKTTLADALGELLAERDLAHGIVDMDWLSRYWPASDGDRFNVGLGLANVSSVSNLYRGAGAQILIVAGVIEDPETRVRYSDAIGTELWLVRLTASSQELERRLLERHKNNPREQVGH